MPLQMIELEEVQMMETSDEFLEGSILAISALTYFISVGGPDAC